jgi:hypothetical protein
MRLRIHLLALLLLSAALPAARASDALLAFPGAQGAAAHTPGGRGGKILRVTTLAASGPGSLLAALEADGPRIVVFEVGGVIDMAQHEIKISKPFLTVAGQTAPAPGITLIRTGIDVTTHDVVLQHIRVRTGSADQAKRGGWEPDAFSTISAHDVIVDHCSMSWAIDENLSASGPRFTGKTPEDWRRGTSYRVTFSNNIISEGLKYATHSKGEHSKGSLIHDNASDILIVGNLYANNYERNPLFKGGVHGMVINNLIYNPGPRAVHYNLIAEEWRDQPYQVGQMALIGNVLRGGPSTPPGLALFMLGGSGDVELYEDDNIAVDWVGRPLQKLGRYTTSSAHRADGASDAAAQPEAATRRRSSGRSDSRSRRPPVGSRSHRRAHRGRHDRRSRRDHRRPGASWRLSALPADAAGVRREGVGFAVHDEEEVTRVTWVA